MAESKHQARKRIYFGCVFSRGAAAFHFSLLAWLLCGLTGPAPCPEELHMDVN